MLLFVHELVSACDEVLLDLGDLCVESIDKATGQKQQELFNGDYNKILAFCANHGITDVTITKAAHCEKP